MPWKSITSMICITILTSIALLKGIDGALFMVGAAAIAGIAGYTIGHIKKP